MTFTPARRPGGWVLEVAQDDTEPVVLDVDRPVLHRGAVRGALTVRRGRGILFRDTVNLTSGQARSRLLKALAEKGALVPEAALIALDEVCRHPGAGACTHDPDIAATIAEPVDFVGLRAAFDKWLLIADPALLLVVVGAALAHRLGFDPVWLLMVAPPGGTKTEVLRSFFGATGFYPISELTPKTFASGLEVPGGHDPSLLSRLTDEILLLKDFTTVLEMRGDDRQAILAQLREIYDGRFDKTWGTGRELHWEGHLGFVAGVTPVIDRHHGAMAVLGERFLLFRPELPDRRQLARRALDGTRHQQEMRRDLTRAMHGFLGARGHTIPEVASADLNTLARVSDFVTRARSGVYRDRWKREFEYAPEPEAPTRFAKALLALASGIALAHDRVVVTPQDLRVACRVALDCLPLIRRRTIAALAEQTISGTGDDLTTRSLAGTAQFSTSTIRRALEDLQSLGIVSCTKAGKTDYWSLHPDWQVIFGELTAAPTEEPPPTETPPTDEAGNGIDPDPPPRWTCGFCRSTTRFERDGRWVCGGCHLAVERDPGMEG